MTDAVRPNRTASPQKLDSVRFDLLPIVPEPVQLARTPGEFSLHAGSSIATGWAGEAVRAVAERLATQLRPATGYELRVRPGPGRRHDIALAIGTPAGLPESGRAEGYALTAGDGGLTLTAPTERGLHNAAQTLLQLLPARILSTHAQPGRWPVPGVRIVDHPRYGYRALSVDLRDGFLSTDAVTALIDRIAAYKLNVLQLRLGAAQGLALIADTAPELLTPAARDQARAGWTRADYQRIVSHAAARFVTVVPEVDGTGRGDSAADPHWARRIAVLSGLATLTPGPYQHIGGPADDPGVADVLAAVVAGLGKTAVVRGWPQVPVGAVSEYRGGAEQRPEQRPEHDRPAPRTAARTVSARTVSARTISARTVMAPPARTLLDNLAGSGEPGGGGRTRLLDRLYNWDPADYDPRVGPAQIVGLQAEVQVHAADGGGADRVDRLVFPGVLATAELGWSPRLTRTPDSAAYAGFVARVAAHGVRLSLSGIGFDVSPAVPWQVELAAARPAVRHGRVLGDIAVLAAPDALLDRVGVRVDWGDGTVAPAAVHRDGDTCPIRASHRYERRGTYRVTVEAAVADGPPARLCLVLHVRRPLRAHRPRPGSSAGDRPLPERRLSGLR